MSSTYSPSLRIELIGSGDQAGAWGTTTDNNLTFILDSAIAGYQDVTIGSSTQILTAVYGPASTPGENQSIYSMLSFSGSPSTTTTVYAPPFPKQYILKNSTAQSIVIYNSTTIGGASPRGTGATVLAGATAQVWSDGYSFYSMTSAVGSSLYPVGSIYTNATNATNPASLLGFGTWAAFGAGRVAVGFDSSNTLFDTAEETGGSADAIVASHTHTATFTGTAMGNHTHTLAPFSSSPGGGGGAGGGDWKFDYGGTITTAGSSAGTPAGSVSVASAGVSETNANYQPYITVYMWKRTA